jgi:hypothetical protein
MTEDRSFHRSNGNSRCSEQARRRYERRVREHHRRFIQVVEMHQAHVARGRDV